VKGGVQGQEENPHAAARSLKALSKTPMRDGRASFGYSSRQFLNAIQVKSF
jgi:hypothetical protein